MKYDLPQKVKNVECGIINLEESDEDGSHWTAYYKNNDIKYYFDSYGNTRLPKEISEYKCQKICFILKKYLKIIMI